MKTYVDNFEKQTYLKLLEILSTLPPYCKDYFRSIETKTTIRTQLAYGYDISVFFNYLSKSNVQFSNIKNITLNDLSKLNFQDIEEYIDYIKYYQNDNISSQNNQIKEISNSVIGIKRKISSLKSFFNYFYKNELIKSNPTLNINMPKLREKSITRLDPNEVAILLDKVESGELLTNREKQFHHITKDRDIALLTLLLGTGIRVSECVGIDINDIDFSTCAIKIHRKGGKEVFIYFGDEVESALKNYIDNSRKKIIDKNNLDEPALFLSLQNKRLGQRAIEKLVKKYSKAVVPLKHITPHKLRSTYGTNLYRETNDIYLVAEVLGHSDVNTTKKHYAAIDEDLKKNARNIVKLRSND